MAIEHRDTSIRQSLPVWTGTGVVLTFIHNSRHVHSQRLEVGGCIPAIVVGGYNHNLPAGEDTEKVNQSLHSTSQHNARQVVVIENKRRFIGTGCHNHRFRPYLEQTRSLHGAKPVVLIPTQNTRIGENRNIRLLINCL